MLCITETRLNVKDICYKFYKKVNFLCKPHKKSGNNCIVVFLLILTNCIYKFINIKKQLFTSFLLIGVFQNVYSQTPIRVAHLAPFIHNESKIYTLAGRTYKFGTDADPSLADPLQLQSFEAKTASHSGVYSYLDQTNLDLEIFLRRNLTRRNAANRDILYFERKMINDTFHTKYPYYPTVEENFHYRFIGVGSDNSFHNYHATQGTINSIERIDIITRTGINYNSNTEGGIAVFERGIVGSHDGVIVGIITGIDANGVPTYIVC